ncbi:MAG: hypothetical protein JWO86_8416 [Myxococcaceae bacterium]|nr:hypothetical protein [Myxococcaceae bacterium]MEA2747013.1 hypothetical protein [Myxococcales bacterium]
MTIPRSRWKLALPLLPFLLGAIALRLAIAPLGDALAKAVVRVALELPAAPSSEPAVASLPPAPLPPAAVEEGMPVLPRRIAARAPVPHRDPRETRETIDEPRDGATDGGRAASAGERSDPPKSTIVVPASVVTRALERRDVAATNVTTPDGAPLGARLAGVGKYKTGLRDGDVVVTVAGTRTPTVEAMVSAAMAAASSGAPRISGRILRGDATYTVVLELPRQ